VGNVDVTCVSKPCHAPNESVFKNAEDLKMSTMEGNVWRKQEEQTLKRDAKATCPHPSKLWTICRLWSQPRFAES